MISVRPACGGWFGLLLCAFLITATVHISRAQTDRPPPQALQTNSPGTIDTFWDSVMSAHETASDLIYTTSDSLDRMLHNLLAPEREERGALFDRFFGDRTVDEDEKDSRVIVRPELRFDERDGTELDLDVDLKLSLPRTKERLQLLFDNLEPDEDPFDVWRLEQSRALEDEDEREGRAALRVYLARAIDYSISADAGVDFKPEPVPAVDVRFRARTMLGPWGAKFTEKVFWESDEGWGEKTQFDLEREDIDPYYLRLSANALWSESSDGLELAQAVWVSRRWGAVHRLGFKAAVREQTRPARQIRDISARLPFRSWLSGNWLYSEIEPGVDFEREHDFDANPLITLKIGVVLGRVR